MQDTDHGRDVLITDVMSVTYAATIALMFRCFSCFHNWGRDVMIMMVSQDTLTAMKAYVGP